MPSPDHSTSSPSLPQPSPHPAPPLHIQPHTTEPPPTPGTEQQEITLGVPLLCVLHKGQHAVANREACRACSVGLVVTVPYRGTTDYCHMCSNCGVKDVTNHWVRDPHGIV